MESFFNFRPILDINAARERFPAGLEQPEGSYRFGLDALLLAGYAVKTAEKMFERRKRKPLLRIVEAGCGCGAAILAVAMRTEAMCLGLDSEESLVRSARNNATRLGLEERVSFCVADLAQKGFFCRFGDWQGLCQLVLANPPWLQPAAGKAPQSALRQKAICAEPDSLELFCSRSSGFLPARGVFCCILPPGLLTDFCKAAEMADLALREILPVASHAGEVATRMLLLCRKNLRPDPALQSPLILHQSDGTWTRDALAFCPWLKAGSVSATVCKAAFSAREEP